MLHLKQAELKMSGTMSFLALTKWREKNASFQVFFFICLISCHRCIQRPRRYNGLQPSQGDAVFGVKKLPITLNYVAVTVPKLMAAAQSVVKPLPITRYLSLSQILRHPTTSPSFPLLLTLNPSICLTHCLLSSVLCTSTSEH